MPLDFKRAADLFTATPEELAMALGISPKELERYRERPGRVEPELLRKMGEVLVERGRGMVRVGEMLTQE